jgi:hypothetical protein
MLLMFGCLAGNESCKAAATGILDYLLGKNPTNYSYVTGYGDKVPMNPHHRPSGGDNIADPVPGFLVGGPNAGREDSQECTYASTAAALSYNDNQSCYACNEIAINWNAPMVFLTGAAEVFQSVVPSSALQNGKLNNEQIPLLIKSSPGSISLQIPQQWKNGIVSLTDLHGRVLKTALFHTSGKLTIHTDFPSQLVIISVISEYAGTGKSSVAFRTLTGRR